MADRAALAGNPDLTPFEETHISVMKAIAKAVADTPMVLKGGTALLLVYGLDRFSEDLDFDSSKAISLENRIQQAASKHVKVKAIDLLKDTDTVSRYRLLYESKHGEGRLKIETSLRTQPANFQLISGIKVYELPALIEQKLNAIENRTTARDLYDINFLANTYPEKISEKQWERIDHLSADLNSLERRFSPAFEDDLILAKQDVSKLILSLHEASQKQPENAINLSKSAELTIKSYVDKQVQLAEMMELRDAHLSDQQTAQHYIQQAHQLSREITEVAKVIQEDKHLQTVLKAQPGYELYSLQKTGGFQAIQARMAQGHYSKEDILTIAKDANSRVLSQHLARSYQQQQHRGRTR